MVVNGHQNCSNCRHRGELSYTHHIECNHPLVSSPLIKLLLVTAHPREIGAVEISEHGWKNGWASWPMEFDQIWINKCNIFEPVES